MAVVTPMQTSFNAGELSERLNARIDQNVRTIGVKQMLGFLPLLQGPAETAPGTLFVAPAKGPFRVLPYEFIVTQGYVIEAGENYFRFYTNDVRIETSPGTAYELATPWTYAQIEDLWFEQNRDALYCFHPVVPTQRLYRTSADTFAIEPCNFRNGPLETRNNVETLTVTPSAVTGTGITITSSDPLFEAGDVGGLMELEGGDFASIAMWEPGIECATGQFRQWNGNVYECTGGSGRTGTVPPIHDEGVAFDGMGTGTDINGKGPYGVQWTYRYNRYGLIEFTGFTSSTVMTATVLRQLPTSAPMWRWRFGAFSTRRGWPQCGVVWQDRLVLGKDNVAYGSVSGDFENHARLNELGDISRDMAFARPIGDPNTIQWMFPDRTLHLGTSAAEWQLAASSAGEGVGPGNLDDNSPSGYGSAPIRPVRINGRAVYVQAARAKVLQMAYDSDRLLAGESPDLTRFADHMGISGFKDMAWQKEPEQLLWLVRDDGTLAVSAYVPDEQLLGWAQRQLAEGLVAKWITTITDPDGRYKQVWLAVQAGSAWWMLRMAPVRRTGETAVQVMTDAAIHYQGAATATITAAHLAGRTVQVVADGKAHRDVTLNGSGVGTLDYTASSIHFGLEFPAEIKLLPREAGVENGPAQFKKQRINRIDMRVLQSLGLEIEVQGVSRKIEQQTGSSVLDAAFAPFTGDIICELTGKHDRVGEVTIRRYLPFASTLCGVMQHGETAQS